MTYVRVFFAFCFVLCTGVAMAIEEPKYTMIEQSGDFELRGYAPMIIAETTVTGDLKSASRTGFKRIADYIFGNNTSAAGEREEVSMTAPVAIEEKAMSQEISMTAPVTMTQSESQWRMHFVMPSQYTMATLPKPNNSAVKLREVPARNYAVVKFSWFAGEAKVAKKTAALLAWMKAKDLTPVGAPSLARYNPPWTLPFLRRNEVMVAYE